MNKDKYSVSLCYLYSKGEIGKDVVRKGYNVFGLNIPSGRWRKFLSFANLKKVIKKEKFQILHSHGTAALVDASICKLIYPRFRLIHTFHFGNYPN